MPRPQTSSPTPPASPPSTQALHALDELISWTSNLDAADASLVAAWCENHQDQSHQKLANNFVKNWPNKASISKSDFPASDHVLNQSLSDNPALSEINTKPIRWALRTALVATQGAFWLSPSERTAFLALLDARELVSFIHSTDSPPIAEFVRNIAPSWDQSAKDLITTATQLGPLPVPVPSS